MRRSRSCSCDASRCGRCSASPAPAPTAPRAPGEIGIAFGTDRRDRRAGRGSPTTTINRLFAAAFEAAQESVYNCLVAARPSERLDGTMQPAFPIDEIVASVASGRGNGLG